MVNHSHRRSKKVPPTSTPMRNQGTGHPALQIDEPDRRWRACWAHNRTALGARTAARPSLSRADAATALDALVSAIADALDSGEAVNLASFGRFTAHHLAARQGRNPRTGETVAIAARTVPTFKSQQDSSRQAQPLARRVPQFYRRRTCGTRRQRAYASLRPMKHRCTAVDSRPLPGLLRQEDPRGGPAAPASPEFASVTGHRALASPLARYRDVRGRDDHQRPERVAIAAVQSFVRITGTPETGQHPGSPTAGALRSSPATAALAGSHSSPLGVRITPWPARVRPGLNTDAFGSLTPPQSGIERRSEPRRRHRNRRCGYEGRRDVALDGSRRGGRYSTRARRRCRFGSEVTH